MPLTTIVISAVLPARTFRSEYMTLTCSQVSEALVLLYPPAMGKSTNSNGYVIVSTMSRRGGQEQLESILIRPSIPWITLWPRLLL